MPRCDTCGCTDRVTYFEMQPGRDGAPWWLCSRCFRDGLESMRPHKEPEEVSPEMIAAMKTAGYEEVPVEGRPGVFRMIPPPRKPRKRSPAKGSAPL